MKNQENLRFMKKVIVVIALALIALTAKAQVYVGGQLVFQGQAASGNSSAFFGIAPEVGYAFNDNMAAGVSLGFGFGNGATQIIVDPYFRYFFAELGPVRFFADANFNFTNISAQQGESASSWGIGIMPGIAVPINDNWSLVGHVARLGYYDGSFSFNLNNITIVGVYYQF